MSGSAETLPTETLRANHDVFIKRLKKSIPAEGIRPDVSIADVLYAMHCEEGRQTRELLEGIGQTAVDKWFVDTLFSEEDREFAKQMYPEAWED